MLVCSRLCFIVSFSKFVKIFDTYVAILVVCFKMTVVELAGMYSWYLVGGKMVINLCLFCSQIYHRGWPNKLSILLCPYKTLLGLPWFFKWFLTYILLLQNWKNIFKNGTNFQGSSLKIYSERS